MMKIALFLVFAFIATAYGSSRILMNGNLHGSYVVPEDGVNNQINLGFSGEVALRVEVNQRQMAWYFHHTATDGVAGTFNGVSFWQGKPGVRGELLWDASDAEEISGNGASPHYGWNEWDKVDDEDEDDTDVFGDIVDALNDGELYIQLTTTHYTDGLLRAQFDQHVPTYAGEVGNLNLKKNVFLTGLSKHAKSKAKLHGDFVLPHGVTTDASGSVSVKYNYDHNSLAISYSTSTDHNEQVWSDVLFLTGNDDTQDTSTPNVLWDFSLLPEENSNDENPLKKGKIEFPATQYALRQIFDRSNTYLLVEDGSVPHIRGNLENSHASTIVFSMAIIVLVALINILF